VLPLIKLIKKECPKNSGYLNPAFVELQHPLKERRIAGSYFERVPKHPVEMFCHGPYRAEKSQEDIDGEPGKAKGENC
jgi:hypothetical protein